MKVALVCSWLNQYGGAERVLEVLHQMYPEAPIYTSIHWPQAMPPEYRDWDIRPSFMNRLPFVKRHHQAFLPIYPLAFERFDLSEYDLVISNSSAFCQGVRTGPNTTHICYCLTPARFLWDYDQYIVKERISPPVRAVIPLVIHRLRSWDLRASQRVDHFVAISQVVANRIQRYYGRQARIIYPSIDAAAFAPSDEVDDFFLIVSRLIPYKQIDLAVQAFNLTGLPLKIAGDGRYRPNLERMAKPNVQFLGRVSDAEIKRLYSRCRALIFPGEEDFGLTPLEAQASGRPVIAFAQGGALETVLEGETGEFFHEPSAEALAEVLSRFDHRKYDPARIRCNAERFDVARFKSEFSQFVSEAWEEHRALNDPHDIDNLQPLGPKHRDVGGQAPDLHCCGQMEGGKARVSEDRPPIKLGATASPHTDGARRCRAGACPQLPASLSILFCCPKCHTLLVEEGSVLSCKECRVDYPLIERLPNFTGEDPFYEGKWAETDFSTGGIRNLLVKKERFFVRHIRGVAGTVLDLGCGGGWKLLTRVGPVVGVDLSLSSLLQARRIYARVARAKLTELPFADETFDCVVSCDVLGHLEHGDKDTAIGEICRVLKPGGRTIHYVETEGYDPLMRFAREYPELYRKYIIDPEGHIGLEDVAGTIDRFRSFGLEPVEEAAVYRGLTYAGRLVQYFDNEYREKSAAISALASVSKALCSSKVTELMTNVVMAGLIEVGDRVFPASWSGGVLVCYEKRKGGRIGGT